MKGFTLAEILITLGIIGVVAALTIPGLINKYKAHRLHSQFLESYSTIQQVFKQMEADDVSLDIRDYGTGKFYKTFMRYLQAPFDCGLGGDWGDINKNTQTKPCYKTNTSDRDTPYKTFDGEKTVSIYYFDDGQIALQDGTLLLFENYNGAIFISVDLNGYNNPPNRYGYDLFTFDFVEGELKTMGDTGTHYTDQNQYCNEKEAINNLNGIACAHKAKINPDYFKYIVNKIK